MQPTSHRPCGSRGLLRGLVAVLCAALLLPGEALALPQAAAATAGAADQDAPKLPPDQLDALVAPVALYPDDLLAQVLAASTYPLEVIQLQQWLTKNKGLKDKALVDAVGKQPWDPSVQGLASLPDVVKRLADDIQWTTDLGNAFLAQQSDVMDAVQRMRKKAQGTGALASNKQQKVETKVVEEKTVIIVQPADPQVVYVPTYNPVVVYGPPIYPYPPVYYPPYNPGAVVVGFGVGLAVGAAWGGAWGGWGYHCGWGSTNNININVNNNYIHNTNINNTNINRGGNNNNNTWQHNPQHRGGAPYANQATANKYGGGGSTRGASPSTRPTGLSQQQGQGSRPAGATPGGAANRSGGESFGGGAGSREGGGDRIGSREIPKSSPSSARSNAFGGGSGGFSGESARASSFRGASSMGSHGGWGGGGRMGGGGGGRRR